MVNDAIDEYAFQVLLIELSFSPHCRHTYTQNHSHPLQLTVPISEHWQHGPPPVNGHFSSLLLFLVWNGLLKWSSIWSGMVFPHNSALCVFNTLLLLSLQDCEEVGVMGKKLENITATIIHLNLAPGRLDWDLLIHSIKVKSVMSPNT